MIEWLDNMENKGIYLSLVISVLVIFLSGIFFGVTYFVMDEVDTALRSTDCVIDDNLLMDSCQDLFQYSVLPLLGLRSVLIWANFFFIFGLTISLLILGYRSGSSPVMLGVMVVFVGGLTYISIYFANAYIVLIENASFRSMMVEFTVYNKIMINFPWFMFFVGLFSVILGIVNFQKTSVNTPDGELNY